MTSLQLERHYLSLRCWLLKCVLPASLLLLGLLLALPAILSDPTYIDQTAAIFGFFILYFVLVRGGHLFMIRSMHMELKQTYGDRYERLLSRLPEKLHRQNIGFRLARIKRELINTKLDNRY